MSSYQYVAYGSNLHPGRLQKRVPSAALVGTGLLPGYRLTFHKRSDKDGSGKCNILVGGAGVYVAVYEIPNFDREILDTCEGLGTGYHNRDVQLDGFGECSTYVADSRVIDDSVQPMDWYKEYVLQGALYHGFPGDYLAQIECLAAVVDSDETRAALEWGAIKALENLPGQLR